jgi:hypothetical protein
MTCEKLRDESINPPVTSEAASQSVHLGRWTWITTFVVSCRLAGILIDVVMAFPSAWTVPTWCGHRFRTVFDKEMVMIPTGRLTALALVLAGLAIVPMSAESELPLDGWYIADGFDTDGTRYRALVALRRDAQSYRVTMFVSQPSEASEPELAAIGVALQSGDVLAVNYYTPDHARLAMYRIEGQGRLTGQWILVGGDGTAHAETLTRIADTLSMATVPSLTPACVKGSACSPPTFLGRGL